MSDTILCFSYGSNMSSAYVKDYCPSAEAVMTGTLPNFRIEFRRYSFDLKGGLSSIIPSPGGMVRGVFYRIKRQEIEDLDKLEDVPKDIYRRETFQILGEDGNWHAADLYRVANPLGPYRPARQYVEWMLAGAKEHGLPEDYIKQIEGYMP